MVVLRWPWRAGGMLGRQAQKHLQCRLLATSASRIVQFAFTNALGMVAAFSLHGCSDTSEVATECAPESLATNHVCGIHDNVLIYCSPNRCCSFHGYCGRGAAYCDDSQTDYHSCPAHLSEGGEEDADEVTTTETWTTSTSTTTPGYGDCVGGWSVWSECSATCDTGTWSRTYVVAVSQRSGGAPCEADHGSFQRTTCNMAECPPTMNITPHETSTPAIAMYAFFTLGGFVSAAIIVWTLMLIKRRRAVVAPMPAHLVVEDESRSDCVGKSYELAPPELRGWTLERVHEEQDLRIIEGLLKVSDPKHLGIGRDVRRGQKYNKLALACAWKIQKPAQKALYTALKSVLRSEMAQIQTVSNQTGQPDVKTKLDYEAGLLDADSSVSEKLLLHGTKPENVLQIIQNGLNERFSSGLFGQGVYLAEDAEKIDQYCTPDTSFQRAGHGLHLLHGELYTSVADHPGEVFYCFVVRAPLGQPAYTRDGSTHAAAPRESIWATADRRELVPIPKLNPPVHYHSLIAEVGTSDEFKLRRHREFVIFHGERCMLEYLLAYKRVQMQPNAA